MTAWLIPRRFNHIHPTSIIANRAFTNNVQNIENSLILCYVAENPLKISFGSHSDTRVQLLPPNYRWR